MPTIIKPYIDMQIGTQKMYFLSIIYDKNISWEFCMNVLTEIFHKNKEDAELITNHILIDGECLCGFYNFEIAESKSKLVEELAEKEGFSLYCLMEEA